MDAVDDWVTEAVAEKLGLADVENAGTFKYCTHEAPAAIVAAFTSIHCLSEVKERT